jgi:hypothetical protein
MTGSGLFPHALPLFLDQGSRNELVRDRKAGLGKNGLRQKKKKKKKGERKRWSQRAKKIRRGQNETRALSANFVIIPSLSAFRGLGRSAQSWVSQDAKGFLGEVP